MTRRLVKAGVLVAILLLAWFVVSSIAESEKRLAAARTA
jgi:hypothetical protein